MRKILPILLATAVYLTPLYPVYAQNAAPAASVKRIAKPSTPANATAAEKLEAARAQATQARDTAMEKMEGTRERVSTRAAELKTRLARFRDKAKAGRVEDINNNLAALNERKTTQMQSTLERISGVLNKLKTWVAEQKAAGKDVSALEQAISDTEVAWASADNAIKNQVDNDYTIIVNSESTVKADAKTARDRLHNDLKAVHDKIINTRQTLATALSSWN